MPKPKPPTAKSITRQITKLLLDLSRVYQEPGVAELRKTNEHGTIVILWKDGRSVLEEKKR